MKRLTIAILLIFSLILAVSGCSKDSTAETTYNYYTAAETKEAIEKGNDIILLDIQVEEEWNAHHIAGAIPTYAYPVKTDEEKSKLDAVLPQLQGEQPIIVICPGGGGGATRTIDYLITKGIKAERLFIMENGQSKWPYPELLETDGSVVEAITFLEGYVAEVDWLRENLNKENLLILDARGQDAYDKGHIPGAIVVTWQGFANMQGAPGDANWGTVLDAAALSEKLSALGVSKDKEIIVYTNTVGGWGEDGRIVWMLRRAGIDNARILDGGFNMWSAKGYDVSKESVTPTPTNVEILDLDNSTSIDTDELAAKLSSIVIIDTREKDEFEGAAKFGEARGGHLPGAINIPFNQFLNNDGTLKAPKDIKAILDENGINKDDEIVTYCTAGIRSAHMQLVLSMLGYNNSKNYDASFYAWASNSALEVVK